MSSHRYENVKIYPWLSLRKVKSDMLYDINIDVYYRMENCTVKFKLF